MLGLKGADVVLFGIEAGVRLFGAARQSYIDRTRERAVTLPLPGLSHAQKPEDAISFFFRKPSGKAAMNADPRAAELATKFDDLGEPGLTKVELDELMWLYEVHRGRSDGTSMAGGLRPDDAVAALTIRQWNAGEEPPSSFRRVAGTLVEIGVDYYSSGPGAGKLAGNSPSKAVVRDLLTVLDDKDFTSVGLDTLFQGMFVATLESIADNPRLASGDPKAQLLISSVAKGLADDLNERLKGLGEDKARVAGGRLGTVAELVFRSVLRSGADTVLSNPGTFLGHASGTGQAELMTKVGRTILGVVLDKDTNGVDLEALFTGETLDIVVKAAMGVVAEHPDVLGLSEEDGGISKVLTEVAAGLAASTRELGIDMFPDLARLVIERTGANLHLIWGEGDGAENLALVGVQTVLAELSRQPESGSWRPRLSKSQLLLVTESILDELADNPQLILTELGGTPVLQDVLRIVIEELAAKELDKFSGDTVVGLVHVAVRAASDRWSLLEELPGGDGTTAMGAIIDALFAAAVDPKNDAAAWTLAKGSVQTALLEAALTTLAEKGVSKESVDNVRDVVKETQADLAQGRFSIAAFRKRLEDKFQIEAGAA